MSVDSGKLEVAGIVDDTAYLRYHQAKNMDDLGKIITANADAVWMESEKPLFLKDNKFAF
jgi:hypothetical protein